MTMVDAPRCRAGEQPRLDPPRKSSRPESRRPSKLHAPRRLAPNAWITALLFCAVFFASSSARAEGVAPAVATGEAEASAAPPPANLWYLRLGYGAVRGDNLATGPALGVGYRIVPKGRYAVDLSLFNFVFTSKD